MSYTLENRIKAEKAITKALIKAIIDNGYTVSVYDGEEMHHGLTAKQAFDTAMNVDECKIYAANIVDGRRGLKAMFYMVYGNDGYDCICDCSVNKLTDKINDIVEKVADKWEEKLC